MTSSSSSKSEQQYILSSILSSPPLRSDGRSLPDYRPIALETGVAPLANGSAHVSIGGGAGLVGVGGALPGTEVLAVVKLEVEDVDVHVDERGGDGRIVCNVSCSPSAYPNLLPTIIDDIQHDYAALLSETLSHPSLSPKNLTILPIPRLNGKKRTGKGKQWTLYLDLLILSDAGNIFDALFLAANAALRDTRVPRTRAVEYRARARNLAAAADPDAGPGAAGDGDVEMQGEGSGLDTRNAVKRAVDFELEDYWDEGEPLLYGSDSGWPVCVTLNLVSPVHYLDATSMEESATSLRVLLLFSFSGPDSNTSENPVSKSGFESVRPSKLHGIRLLGPGEVDAETLKGLLRRGETYARELVDALDAQVRKSASQGKRGGGKSLQ